MTPPGWVLRILADLVFGGAALLCVIGAAVRVCRKVRDWGKRLVSDRPQVDKHHPGLPWDGKPLTWPERERLEQIKRGMWKTASEPGRRM